MSAIIDFIVQQTDPVTAVLLLMIVFHTHSLRKEFRRAHKQHRRRLRRLEDELLDDNTDP